MLGIVFSVRTTLCFGRYSRTDRPTTTILEARNVLVSERGQTADGRASVRDSRSSGWVRPHCERAEKFSERDWKGLKLGMVTVLVNQMIVARARLQDRLKQELKIVRD